MENKELMKELVNAIEAMNVALASEMGKINADSMENLEANSPEDISARYWLMQFLEPLNRKEIKSIIDGFLVQLLNEEQSKKLVKFLLSRFPHYYKTDIDAATPNNTQITKEDIVQSRAK